MVVTGTVTLTFEQCARTLGKESPALYQQAECAWVAHVGHVGDLVGQEASAPVHDLCTNNVSFTPPRGWAARYSENSLQARVKEEHGSKNIRIW